MNENEIDRLYRTPDQHAVGCPFCGASQARWLGHEIRGVYDGVLFWTCMACAHAWPRWTDGRRGEIAGSYAYEINAALSVRDEP